MFIQNWRTWKDQAGKKGLHVPDSFDTYYNSLLSKVNEYDIKYADELKADTVKQLQALKAIAMSKYTVQVSKTYGTGAPEGVFAENNEMLPIWNAGEFSGWIQINFDKARKIKSITTNFGRKYGSMLYSIEGSLDGKSWFPLVKKRTTRHRTSGRHKVLLAKDVLPKAVKVKSIRTHM